MENENVIPRFGSDEACNEACEIEMKKRDLAISTERDAKKHISDLITYGKTDNFALLCKASSELQGFSKSTKVCNVKGGCIVQVSTLQRNNDGTNSIAEALSYVPNVHIDTKSDPRKLVDIRVL